jgi:hypothetical protein
LEIENLKRISKEKKIPISKIERDIGFPRGSIFKWKNTEPSIQKVKKVADYLGVRIDKLL